MSGNGWFFVAAVFFAAELRYGHGDYAFSFDCIIAEFFGIFLTVSWIRYSLGEALRKSKKNLLICWKKTNLLFLYKFLLHVKKRPGLCIAVFYMLKKGNGYGNVGHPETKNLNLIMVRN